MSMLPRATRSCGRRAGAGEASYWWKYLRAEPVAALYEQGKARHAGCFPLLEDEMCDVGVNGLSPGASPDRLDALVWAITAMLKDRYWDGPRITQL
jgi:phage terminase large subunit-like protein